MMMTVVTGILVSSLLLLSFLAVPNVAFVVADRNDNAEVSPLSDLWLRREPVTSCFGMYAALDSVEVKSTLSDSLSLEQMNTASKELEVSLTQMLGRKIPSSCCSDNSQILKAEKKVLSFEVNSDYINDLGEEGYEIKGTSIKCGTPSALLYAAFYLLDQVQLCKYDLDDFTVTNLPNMHLRIWDLWDQISGDVTRGFSGYSVIWPHAIWEPWNGPPPSKLFLAPCNESDPFQRWDAKTLTDSGMLSSVKNRHSGLCVTAKTHNDPIEVAPCPGTSFLYNMTTKQLQSMNGDGVCWDVNHALGPDIDFY